MLLDAVGMTILVTSSVLVALDKVMLGGDSGDVCGVIDSDGMGAMRVDGKLGNIVVVVKTAKNTIIIMYV